MHRRHRLTAFHISILAAMAVSQGAYANPLLTISAPWSGNASTFLPLNAPGLEFNANGDPSGCLISGASIGCSNAFRDAVVFYFRNDTSQPVVEIRIDYSWLPGVGGGIELGFYSESAGVVAPTSAVQVSPQASFFFDTPIGPGQLSELLWVAKDQGNLQPGGGQLLILSALTSAGGMTQSAVFTTPPTFVPEPSTALVLGICLAALSRPRIRRAIAAGA
jgi:hypothetical protein